MTETTSHHARVEPAPAARSAPPGGGRHRLASTIGLLALAASAVFGSNVGGIRDRVMGTATPPPRAEAQGREAGRDPVPGASAATTPTTVRRTILRSQPWWQTVAQAEGSGPARVPSFTIAPDAIQWRLSWSCGTGRLRVERAGGREPLIDTACPGADLSYASRSGPADLRVTTDGPWALTVEQQLDVPLNEPPLAAMSAATRVSTGSFYRVDQVGQGSVVIHRLPDGSWALRLDEFYVTPNVDLEIRLSPLAEPRSTDQFTATPSEFVSFLDVTAGSMNFVLPPGVDPRRYRSVVIWCEVLHSAYAAAALGPA